MGCVHVQQERRLATIRQIFPAGYKRHDSHFEHVPIDVRGSRTESFLLRDFYPIFRFGPTVLVPNPDDISRRPFLTSHVRMFVDLQPVFLTILTDPSR